jgi:uncharacterized C2H2 Zn-finger protein
MFENICSVCEKNFYSSNNRQKRPRCIECEAHELYKCIDCNEIFERWNDYKRSPSRCHICNKKHQLKISRERASTINGYLKQLVSTIYNDVRRKKQGNPDVTLSQLLDLYNKQDGKCAISGIEMQLGDKRNGQHGNPYALSLDRIDSDKPYTIDNLQFLIDSVNTFKGQFDLDTMFFITKQIYAKNKLETS